MYIRHIIESIITFLLVTVISFLCKFNFSTFSDTAITVVSISVAVYIAAVAALLGSPYADRLKSMPDEKVNNKSQLGVMTTYLRVAGVLGVFTISISCLHKFTGYNLNRDLIGQAASAISCGIFALNVLYLWLVLSFMSTALLNAAKMQR